MASSSKHGARARTRARRLVLQGLYQWQLSAALPGEIIAQLYVSQNTKDTDTDYFEELLHGSIADNDKLAAAFSPYLDRPLTQLDPIERAIFLLSTYELSTRPDVPYRVVLNEAVELARKFGAEESHKYINAVLDRTSAELRRAERAAD
ncbi:MAG TPA: transcription antitermination factor NusB [Gammaproteobacteria bacterium]|nr:transcription antitermination factor NusB [Gammaproteobacteria bacterium]